MTGRIEIDYFWNLSSYPDLDAQTLGCLKEEAENRIYEMRRDGYVSGELCYEDDTISVNGSWTVRTE